MQALEEIHVEKCLKFSVLFVLFAWSWGDSRTYLDCLRASPGYLLDVYTCVRFKHRSPAPSPRVPKKGGIETGTPLQYVQAQAHRFSTISSRGRACIDLMVESVSLCVCVRARVRVHSSPLFEMLQHPGPSDMYCCPFTRRSKRVAIQASMIPLLATLLINDSSCVKPDYRSKM